MKPQDDNKTTYRLSLWKFKPGSVIQLCHYYSNSDKCFLFCLTFCGRNQAGVIFSWNHRRPYILQCREEGCPRSQDCQTWGECKIMWALIRVITFLICQKIFYIASAIKTILLLFFLHLGIKKHVNRQHMSKAEDADSLGKPRNAVNDHGSTAR